MAEVIINAGGDYDEMVAEFPDDMTYPEIKAALDKKFSQVRGFMSHVWGKKMMTQFNA